MALKIILHAKLTDDSPSLIIYCGRLVLANASSYTDFIKCCNVTNCGSVVPFSLSKGFFVGATTTIITILTCFTYAVTHFDGLLYKLCIGYTYTSSAHIMGYV